MSMKDAEKYRVANRVGASPERGLKAALTNGALAGALWGWLCMAINHLTGVFGFEGGFSGEVAAFTFAGAVFGAASGALLGVAGPYIPFRGAVARGVFTTALIWLILRAGGAALSGMEPGRYHVVTSETAQGLALAVALGCMVGLLSKKGCAITDSGAARQDR
jgi:hypothetical protein